MYGGNYGYPYYYTLFHVEQVTDTYGQKLQHVTEQWLIKIPLSSEPWTTIPCIITSAPLPAGMQKRWDSMIINSSGFKAIFSFVFKRSLPENSNPLNPLSRRSVTASEAFLYICCVFPTWVSKLMPMFSSLAIRTIGGTTHAGFAKYPVPRRIRCEISC